MAQLIDGVEKQERERGLIDGCGRRIDCMRISVIDACDLQCVYCRPDASDVGERRGRPLSDHQRLEFIRFLHQRYGLKHLRITGGEPLLYRSLISFVASVRRAAPDLALAMTTNAHRLKDQALELRRAGLDRLNVSLDSLDPKRYGRITGGKLDDVFAGLEAARQAGFSPPKVNMVVLRDINDDEIIPLAEWALSRGCQVRFLEAMPIGQAAKFNSQAFVSAAEIRATLGAHFRLEPLPDARGGTAKCFLASRGSYMGTVGIISPVSEPFCSGCGRIRLTADGRLYPCLLDSRSVPLSSAWRADSFDHAQADRLVRGAVSSKKPRGRVQATSMVTLGG